MTSEEEFESLSPEEQAEEQERLETRPDHVLSEGAARESWCPEVRRPWTSDTESAASANRAYRDSGRIDTSRWAPCITHDCMFWRVHDYDSGYCAKVCSPADHRQIVAELRAEYRARKAEASA